MVVSRSHLRWPDAAFSSKPYDLMIMMSVSIRGHFLRLRAKCTFPQLGRDCLHGSARTKSLLHLDLFRPQRFAQVVDEKVSERHRQPESYHLKRGVSCVNYADCVKTLAVGLADAVEG